MNLQDFLTNINNQNQSFQTQNFQRSKYQNHNSSFPREGNFNLPNLINGIKNNKNAGDIQSDSDAHEDENSNHVSQFISITEILTNSFAIQNPSILKLHCYSVWQPPQNF